MTLPAYLFLRVVQEHPASTQPRQAQAQAQQRGGSLQHGAPLPQGSPSKLARGPAAGAGYRCCAGYLSEAQTCSLAKGLIVLSLAGNAVAVTIIVASGQLVWQA